MDLQLDIDIKDNFLYVKATFHPLTNNLSFVLNQNAVIDSANFSYEEIIKPFLFLDDARYFSSNLQNSNPILTYHVKVEGFASGIDEKKILLNVYSLCFPTSLSYEVKKTKVCFSSYFNDFDVMDATMEEGVKTFTYDTFMDVEVMNIIALRKKNYYVNHQEGITIYCINEENQKEMEYLSSITKDILSFDQNLYGQKEKNKIELFIFDQKEYRGSAYNRNNRVVLASGFEDKTQYLTMLGHELGHLWFSKSNATTFEDWINETGAEWSCLAFLLKNGYETIFESKMKSYLEDYVNYGSPVLTEDKSRPDNVHLSGTVVFYQIYMDYGIDFVITLLQLLEKASTTEDFFQEIETCYGPKRKDEIKRRLCKKIEVK